VFVCKLRQRAGLKGFQDFSISAENRRIYFAILLFFRMHKGKYVFSQLLEFLSRYEFDKCVKYHKGNQRVRQLSCWDQFLAMSFGQLAGCQSLRSIITCLSAHQSKHYHLGFGAPISRSTLAEANEKRPWGIYQDFAAVLIKQARFLYRDDPDFVLELDNTVYALDSTTIDLCMGVFPWAKFRRAKSGIKLHTQIDLRGNIPTFIEITDAKVSDINILDEIPLESGAIYVMDRGYVSTERLHDIHLYGAFFIVRDKSTLRWKRMCSNPVDKSTGVRCDQIIKFTGMLSAGGYPDKLRRIKYHDAETNLTYVFLTNNLLLDAKLIADLYKARWEVELFFKWIKQHLQIQVFWGTSRNAVHTQVWIAVCAYVLVAVIKKTCHLDKSIYEILQILSVSLFDKTPLLSLLSATDQQIQNSQSQKALF
jgi:hypothetical protein